MAEIHCRYFSGYKPCGLSDECSPSCSQRQIPRHRILVIHLEALGAVLRATSLLPAIHRIYSNAHITWVTKRPGDQLLKNNSLIDRVLTLSEEDLLKISSLSFDVVFCLDKSLTAGGVLRRVQFGKLYGFYVDERSGSILPANPEARELWELGLSNQKKFFENQKPETQLMIEALALQPFARDPYMVFLDSQEQKLSRARREVWSDQGMRPVVGLNTGCAATISYKKLSIEGHRKLIRQIQEKMDVAIVLLGGREDTHRNQEIAQGMKNIILSPTEEGLRDGLVSVDACDIVVTGDSLGMHMAIALKKWVVAWFGPTCAQEIDLYDRGVKVLSPVSCSPCWSRNCQKEEMCYDAVEISLLIDGVRKGLASIGWQPRKTEFPRKSLDLRSSASADNKKRRSLWEIFS